LENILKIVENNNNFAKQLTCSLLTYSHPEEASIADKSEIGLIEVEEGEEPEVFWIALGGHEEYGSLLDGKLFCKTETHLQ